MSCPLRVGSRSSTHQTLQVSEPRVGLIARADNRGLGHLTWEFARHVNPERTLVIDVTASSFPNHLDRYTDPLVVRWDPDRRHFGQGDTTLVRSWLDGLDVVYSAETFYDWRIVDWCAEKGVATVLHVMPELLPEELPAEPTEVWAPTTWRVGEFRCDRVIPVPVAERPHDRSQAPQLRVLHVAGRRAAKDRNGTTALLRALREVKELMTVTITTQEFTLPHVDLPSHVHLRTRFGGDAPSDYWRLYDWHDVLVMPRRYGGLCLPVQEAAQAGLAVIMSDTPPNADYPGMQVYSRPAGSIITPAGHIPMVTVDAEALAETLDRFSSTTWMLDAARTQSTSWAEEHSWGVLLPKYQEALTEASRRSGRVRG